MLLIPERYKLRTSNTFAFSFQNVLRCPADVSFADKRLKHVSQTSSSPKLTKDVFVTKIYGSLGMIRQYHNHKLQTNPWYRKEEPHNIQDKSGRKQRTTKHRTVTETHNGSTNQQRINNNRTIAL